MYGSSAAEGAHQWTLEGADVINTPTSSPIVLTVLWDGTANRLGQYTTQIGAFALNLCTGVDITNTSTSDIRIPDDSQLKIAFDGCGVTHGCSGTIFAAGLSEQIQTVREKLDALICFDTRRVQLNVVGLSRGGCAAIMLAHELREELAAHLTMALFLFDPVPGNLCWTTTLDVLGCTTASKCMDLSHCTNNLKHVTAIYPHEPLVDIAFHAPVIPRLPASGCESLFDATLGCHQGNSAATITAE